MNERSNKNNHPKQASPPWRKYPLIIAYHLHNVPAQEAPEERSKETSEDKKKEENDSENDSDDEDEEEKEKNVADPKASIISSILSKIKNGNQICFEANLITLGLV